MYPSNSLYFNYDKRINNFVFFFLAKCPTRSCVDDPSSCSALIEIR